MKKFLVVAMVACFGLAEAQAAPILVAGPFPVSPFTGTVIDFEGMAESTIITNQYPGVTFSQTGGGAPMIDNSPFLYAYESLSGVGVLTGSSQGPQVATTAGLIATFGSPVTQAGAFLSDTVPLGDYLVQVFGAGGVFLESLLVTAGQLPQAGDPGCDPSAPWTGTGCGVFVGFNRPQGDIVSIQFGPSSASPGSDAFAIDDLTYQVPEPASLLLLGPALAGILLRRRRI